MNRQMLLVGVATVAVMGLLALAASSEPVRVWITPPADRNLPVDQSRPAQPVAASDDSASSPIAWPSWLGTAVRTVGVVVAALLTALLVALATVARRSPLGWRRFRLPRWRPFATLPAQPDETLTVDVNAAHSALSRGAPRNAIVACWMQLERDAAMVGLSRPVADTPAEFVERVVASASVDPAPIGELAALYREARFSRHDLTDVHRAAAADALDRVVAGLATAQLVTR